MKKIILASTSPRRRELLEELGLVFDVVSPSFDEHLNDLKFSYGKIEEIAFYKAKSVVENTCIPALVISADTVVVKDEKILCKPSDKEDAVDMLKLLNGKTHKVVTSIVVMDSETKNFNTESTTSYVTFSNLKEQDILDYVEKFMPLDKAGAYGIQELPDGFISNVDGPYDNIVGLPTKTLIKLLTSINN